MQRAVRRLQCDPLPDEALRRLAALRDEPSVQAVLPFARMWCARESRYVWAAGDRSHCILQAEGGEQGDPLMPAMFSLALRPALRALQSELHPGEQALAYLDDIYILAPPPELRSCTGAWSSICCGMRTFVSKPPKRRRRTAPACCHPVCPLSPPTPLSGRSVI